MPATVPTRWRDAFTVRFVAPGATNRAVNQDDGRAARAGGRHTAVKAPSTSWAATSVASSSADVWTSSVNPNPASSRPDVELEELLAQHRTGGDERGAGGRRVR